MEKTAAGKPDSRKPDRALAPLLSHAAARPRRAGTSFESQAHNPGPAGGSRASTPGPLNATTPTHFHPGQAATSTQSLNQAVLSWRALGLMAENGSDCCDHLEIRAARMCRGGTAPVAVMPCHLTAPGGDSAGRR